MLAIKPELLKGHLDALLLAVLENGPQHGYAVIEELRERSAGALELPWEIVARRRRRTYQLTAAGRKALGEQRATWDQFSAAVNALLSRRPWPAAT